MSAALLAELTRLGVSLARDGDRLVVDGPEAVVNDAMLAVVVEAKSALLAALDAAEGCAPSPMPDSVDDDEPSESDGDVGGLQAGDTGEATGGHRPPSVPARPWSCFACGSTLRSARPAWGDWTCGGCRAIVAGPAETERPWRMVPRCGAADQPAPATSASRSGVVVRWGSERGWIAVRDPASGEWHEIRYQDAPEVWRRALPRRGRGTTGRGRYEAR